MRILHTVASLDPSTGGPARSVPGLADALAQQGLEVHLWSPDIPEGFPAVAGFTLHRGNLEAALDDMGKPDVIHDHGLWLPVNHRVAKIARERGIPRLVSPRGMLEPWALNQKKWKKKLAWSLYQHADLKSTAALHATAASEAKQFEHLGLQNPIHIIPNGVGPRPPGAATCPQRGEMQMGREDQETRARGQGAGDGEQETEEKDQLSEVGELDAGAKLCNKLSSPTTDHRQPTTLPLLLFTDNRQPTTDNSPSAPKTALFLSRIHPKKGLPLLVEAWAKVRPQGWRMRVVGPDDEGHTQAVAALVAKAGLEHEWSFEGAQDDLAKWDTYRAADLFILPTYSENFGICVAEALASGIPVITTTGTPWEGLQQHQCGWWVEPTVEGLADALAQATSIPSSDREAMGLRGQTWVADEFSWSGIASRMSEVYRCISIDISNNFNILGNTFHQK